MKPILIILGLFLVIGIVSAITLYFWMNSETYQVAGEIYNRVDTEEPLIALTFDDGPNENTDAILDVLRDNQVKATFYLIGKAMEEFPEETKAIFVAGHELGNHSYSHERMIFKFNDFIEPEIEKTTNLIRETGYEGTINFRPPYGKKLIFLPLYLQSQNIRTITWDVEPLKALGDQARSSEIVDYVIKHTKSGSIILLHPWGSEHNKIVEALPVLISQLKADGYEFVTVNELLKSHPAALAQE